MCIIAENQTEKQLKTLEAISIAQYEAQHHKKGFWLHFYMSGNGSEFLDYKLPTPSYLEHYGGSGGYAVAWLIDGKFHTLKGQAFLNDVIARFSISFADLSPKRLPYKPNYQKSNKEAHILNKAYSLKSFSTRLKSIQTKKEIPQRAEAFEDLIFWAIKLFAEDLIREYKIIPYQLLEDFAVNQFLYKKDLSTLRAKSRNIFNWYEKRNFEIKEKKYENNKLKYEGTKMTRVENMKKINEERAEEKKRKILNAITGMFAEDLKKKNGKWNIVKISKELNISQNTVKKYLPQNNRDFSI